MHIIIETHKIRPRNSWCEFNYPNATQLTQNYAGMRNVNILASVRQNSDGCHTVT